MTIDEEIKHQEGYAECYTGMSEYAKNEAIGEEFARVAAEHRQLAEWLTELKDLREENKVLTSECDRLIKEKGKLNELKEKAVSDIWRREARLKEAKRLLKAAVEDMSEKNFCAKVCKRDKFACQVSDTCDFKWRYAAEALALIGEDGDAE